MSKAKNQASCKLTWSMEAAVLNLEADMVGNQMGNVIIVPKKRETKCVNELDLNSTKEGARNFF